MGARIPRVRCTRLKSQQSSVLTQEPLGFKSSICRFKSHPCSFLLSDLGHVIYGHPGFCTGKMRPPIAANAAGGHEDPRS